MNLGVCAIFTHKTALTYPTGKHKGRQLELCGKARSYSCSIDYVHYTHIFSPSFCVSVPCECKEM